jgi:hypothetical protein
MTTTICSATLLSAAVIESLAVSLWCWNSPLNGKKNFSSGKLWLGATLWYWRATPIHCRLGLPCRILETYVKWHLRHHRTARPQEADGGEGFQISSVALNTFIKQLRTAESWWCSRNMIYFQICPMSQTYSVWDLDARHTDVNYPKRAD